MFVLLDELTFFISGDTKWQSSENGKGKFYEGTYGA
jgi:hypothetical protein